MELTLRKEVCSRVDLSYQRGTPRGEERQTLCALTHQHAWLACAWQLTLLLSKFHARRDDVFERTCAELLKAVEAYDRTYEELIKPKAEHEACKALCKLCTAWSEAGRGAGRGGGHPVSHSASTGRSRTVRLS